MSRNKLSKRLLVLSAAITMMLCQSAFAAEDQVKEEVAAANEAPVVQMNMQDAMVRAFATNPAIKIAGFEKDAARATLNAARAGRGVKITGSAINNVSANVIEVKFQPTKSKYFSGPTKPPKPNPAL